MGVIGFLTSLDFLAFLRSKADETNSNFTNESHNDTTLTKAFAWKNKNYEVLPQLFNTLALSESQSEMILLGVSLISYFNSFYTLLNNRTIQRMRRRIHLLPQPLPRVQSIPPMWKAMSLRSHVCQTLNLAELVREPLANKLSFNPHLSLWRVINTNANA